MGLKKVVCPAVAGVLGIIVLGGSASQAAILNFDDIAVPNPAVGEFVPNSYHGFNFTSGTADSQFFVENDADYKKVPSAGSTTGFGNSYGATSPANALSNDGGQKVLSISSPTQFNFLGASFSSFAGFNAFQTTSAHTLTITASRAGTAVGTPLVITLDPTKYVQTSAAANNFTNIDKLTFTAAGSTDPAGQNFYLVDDISYTPEPGALSLLGLGAFGLLRRRRAL